MRTSDFSTFHCFAYVLVLLVIFFLIYPIFVSLYILNHNSIACVEKRILHIKIYLMTCEIENYTFSKIYHIAKENSGIRKVKMTNLTNITNSIQAI